jgi:hypothetical protein
LDPEIVTSGLTFPHWPGAKTSTLPGDDSKFATYTVPSEPIEKSSGTWIPVLEPPMVQIGVAFPEAPGANSTMLLLSNVAAHASPEGSTLTSSGPKLAPNPVFEPLITRTGATLPLLPGAKTSMLFWDSSAT